MAIVLSISAVPVLGAFLIAGDAFMFALGASTLIYALSALLALLESIASEQALQRASGGVLADDARVMRPADLRRLVSYLPQDHSSSAVVSVFDAVLLARQSRAAWTVADSDLQRVALALRALGIEDLATQALE